MSELWARLRAALDDLSPRERLALGGMAAAVGCALVWLLVVTPLDNTRRRTQERIARAESQIGRLVHLRAQYDEIAGRLGRVEARIQRGPRGNIFTTLETLARKSAVKIESLEPQAAPAGDHYVEEKVQVVLKNVTLNQLTRYLTQIEASAQLLSIKALRIRTRVDKPDLLDVNFTVSAFEPA